jgi:hypothetical protein
MKEHGYHIKAVSDGYGNLRFEATETDKASKELADKLNKNIKSTADLSIAMVDFDGRIFSFSKETGTFTGLVSTANGVIGDAGNSMFAVQTIIDETAKQYGVNSADLTAAMQRARGELDNAFGSPTNAQAFFGDLYGAATDAKHHIDELLLSMNINPATGERVSATAMKTAMEWMKKKTGLDPTIHNFATYLEQGAGG